MARRRQRRYGGWSSMTATITREVEVETRDDAVIEVEPSDWFVAAPGEDFAEVVVETRETEEVEREYEIEGRVCPGEPAYTGRDESRWSPGYGPEAEVESVSVGGHPIPESEWPDHESMVEALLEAAGDAVEAAEEDAAEARAEAAAEARWEARHGY